ncbi:MAG: hypothetical protein WAM28_08400 [Chlamydiales bacterium]
MAFFIPQIHNSQAPFISQRGCINLKPSIDKICLISGAIFIFSGFLLSSHVRIAASLTMGGGSLCAIGLVKMAFNNSRLDPSLRPHNINNRLEPPTRSYINNNHGNIVRFHNEQIIQFRDWSQRGRWDWIRIAHFDWWMFPINRAATTNTRGPCIASPEVMQALKADARFMEEYREGIELVCRAYGYDANTGQRVVDFPSSLYIVRFGKMLSSLKWFGERELHRNVAAIVSSNSIRLEDWVRNDLEWETPLAWESADSPSLLERQRPIEG